MSYQCKWIRCGKSACKSCPHGPYWYRFWRDGSSTRCEYVGKELPKNAESGGESTRGAPELWKSSSRFDAMLNQRTASIALAYEILGVGVSTPWQTIKDTYKRLMFEYLKKARR